MAIRMTGINSGLDTDSIIKALVSAQKSKVTKVENKLTKSEWTEEIWKDLNTKLYSLYTKQLTKFKTQGSYLTKKVSSSDDTIATATATSTAANGSHTLQVERLAAAQCVTGAAISATSTKATLTSLGMEEGTVIEIANAKGDKKTLEVTSDTTIEDFTTTCKSLGLNANYDTKQKRFFISSATSGLDSAFSIKTTNADVSGTWKEVESLVGAANASDLAQLKDADSKYLLALATGNYTEVAEADIPTDVKTAYNAIVNTGVDGTELSSKLIAYANAKQYVSTNGDPLNKLGLSAFDSSTSTGTNSLGMSVVKAEDAVIVLDGARLTDSSNEFSVNGLKISLKNTTETGKKITLNTTSDVDAVYDMVKDFVKTYNEILEELNKKYNADSARDYNPLTDEEREAMSEDEIEKWETKIKDSLLRKDNTLSSIISSMRSSLLTTTVVDGKSYSLSSFGIVTSSDYTEKGKLHIMGDEDDDTYATETNKLKAALEENPEAVMKTLSEAGQSLYDALTKKMAKTNLSSALTFYNDKQLDNDQTRYKKEISTLEEKLTEMEDKYYKQFSAMEVAMSKLNSQSSYLASLMGTGQ